MATVNLALLFALTTSSGSSIAGPMMVLIMSATGMPSWVGKCLWGVLQTFLDLVILMAARSQLFILPANQSLAWRGEVVSRS